ncbi:MAG: hypothetical protein R3C49_13000 [Planctomycetaceae bacterium]
MRETIRTWLNAIRGISQDVPSILRTFDAQRQILQDQLFSIAADSGKPRGLRWKHCEWLDSRTVVRDPSNNMLTLFQAVNVSFEAIEGGDMDGVEAVSMVRDGCGVFHFHRGRWGTGGRILFNMTPEIAASTSGGDRIDPSV